MLMILCMYDKTLANSNQRNRTEQTKVQIGKDS